MLTETQLRSFASDGYLVVEDVLDPGGVLAGVRNEYEAVMDALYATWFAEGRVKQPPEGMDFEAKLIAAYAAGCDWFQPMDISLPGDKIKSDTPMHFGPAVFDMITNPRVLDLVQDLIGPEITSNPIQHVRIKSPALNLHQDEVRGHLTQTDWHQDRAVALAEADQTKMITVWIAVTDATPENGCLQVVPHAAKTILPHCPKKQTAIADGVLDLDMAISLPVRAGGVVILDPLIPHASLPNVSDGIRWSFDIRYNRRGQPSGRSHFPEFVARSPSQPDLVLEDWRIWRQMWEDARASLSGQPHIDIHRWTSNSPSCA